MPSKPETTTRAKRRPLLIGQTWASGSSRRLVVDLMPERAGQEAALKFREDGTHRTIALKSFRVWMAARRAVLVEIGDD